MTTEGRPNLEEIPVPPPHQEGDGRMEAATRFASDEAEGLVKVIEERREEEATRPGLMARLTRSAKARMAMTVLAGATALSVGAPQAEAGVTVKKVLQGVARVAGPALEHGERIRGMQEEMRAERARAQAHEAERIMRDAEYKLRGIERELPSLDRRIKTAQYEVLKLAATDADAQEVRRIMMDRTGVKIEIWKAAYAGNDLKVEELSRKDRELEESLIPHLRGRPAQRTGDIFIRTIIAGELKVLDLEQQRGYLQDAMGAAGAAFGNAVARYQAHTERAQRAYDLANLGAQIGYNSRY